MDENRVAVVTGAGSGIGRAVAIAFAGHGYRVTLVGRTRATLEETAAACAIPARVAVADVCDEAAVERAFADTVAAEGRIDVLFNSAGVFGGGRPFGETGFDDWRRVIDINLTGSFLASRAAFRAMRDQAPQGGRIIQCGSISAHTPRPCSAAYTASKHAITGLTKSIALDGRAFGIACCQLDIGNAATPMTASFGHGALQADGSVVAEPTMAVKYVADAALFVVGLPADANVLFMTVMATTMPFVGRG